MAGVCHDLAYDFPVAGVGLFSFVLAVIQLLTLLLIIGWILRQRKLAQIGMENAAKALILPVYTWILVVFAIASGIQAIINILFPMKVNDYGRSPKDVYLYSTVYAIAWAVYHFIIEGIALFLCQHGAGIIAVRRTALLAGAWASLTGIIHFFATSSSDHFLTLILAISWEGALVLFYLLLWGLPLTFLFRRPAVYNFAMFWIIFRAANIASNVLQYERIDAGNCLDIFNTWMFFGVLKPFIVYRTLLMDSQYWFGIAVHAGSKKASSDSPRKSLYVPPSAHSVSIRPSGSHSPNLSSVGSGDMTPDALSLRISVDPALGSSPPSGSSFPNPTSYISPPRLQQPHSPTDPFRDRTDSYNVMSPLLGQQLDPTAAREIAVGMDALRSDVQVINFAYLSLGKRYQILGAGGTARVYKGKYKGQPVAIKMIYCMDLTPAIISNFYDEAVILSSLRHPNVVNLIGVCVSPPSLCLVMELCNGNLYEFLHGVPLGRVRGSASEANSHRGGHGHDLDWNSKLIMALGCARGVAKLHAQNPIIVHRDIKSLNFLVTNDLGVKICDFEWSRPQHRYGAVDSVVIPPSARLSSLSSSHSTNAFSAQSDRVPDTLNWTAPETVNSGLCTEKSDIYSLGIVLWELFTGRVPFDDPDALIGGGRQQALRSILARDHDYHPPLSADIPQVVRDLLADMWRKEPGLRPSAQHVVDRLAAIHKALVQQ